MLLMNTLQFLMIDWASDVTTTTDISIKPVKTKYSTSKISTVGSQRLGMDIEEGWRPYSPKEEFVEGRRLIIHKMTSEPLSLEDLVRKCREDNERIIHIQEKIMNDLKSLKTIQRSAEKESWKRLCEDHLQGYLITQRERRGMH